MNNESVSWKFCDQPVTDKLIKEVERMFTIKFPDDYRECAKENNAGQPVPDIFNLSGRGEEVFNSLLSLVSSGSNYIGKVYQILKTRLPENVYPFADDPFGNYICFHYSDDKSLPEIVFWDHELETITKICNSFKELIESLHE